MVCVVRFSDVYLYIHTYIHTYIYIYIYLFIRDWGVLNWETVSFRSCVRTRGLVAYWNRNSMCAGRPFPFSLQLSLLRFGATSFFFSHPPPPNLLSSFDGLTGTSILMLWVMGCRLRPLPPAPDHCSLALLQGDLSISCTFGMIGGAKVDLANRRASTNLSCESWWVGVGGGGA